MDNLVANSRLSLTLAYEILEVLLKAVLVLQETHSDIIVCVAFIQLCEKCTEKKQIFIYLETRIETVESMTRDQSSEFTCCGRS